MFSQHFTNPMHLSTPCFNTNRFKRQTAFRLVATRLGLNMTKIAMIQTAIHMDLMWNSVECRSGLKEAFSENVSKKQHSLTKAFYLWSHPQCPRTDLNKRFLPKPKTITA